MKRQIKKAKIPEIISCTRCNKSIYTKKEKFYRYSKEPFLQNGTMFFPMDVICEECNDEYFKNKN